jgi:hypothetical protein
MLLPLKKPMRVLLVRCESGKNFAGPIACCMPQAESRLLRSWVWSRRRYNSNRPGHIVVDEKLLHA